MANDFGDGRNSIFPLFEWLERIETISLEQKEAFQYQKPHQFSASRNKDSIVGYSFGAVIFKNESLK